MLDQTLIDEFIENGVVVIPSVLSSSEVHSTLDGMHRFLQQHGFSCDDIAGTAPALAQFSSTKGSGGVLDIFYEAWKLQLNEHPVVVSAVQQLWAATYALDHDSTAPSAGNAASKFFADHPFGKFDPREGYMYIDRVCYRVPTEISQQSGKTKRAQLQRSLAPHLDCCPHNMYTGNKWRPIQAFIALTDTLEPEMGGFEACRGLHREFAEWVERRIERQVSEYEVQQGQLALGRVQATRASIGSSGPVPPCVGQFTPIRPKEDQDVMQRMQHIPCKAGDLVCWDYRIPHSNSRSNLGLGSRVCVYVGLLPAVPLNAAYAQQQLERYRRGEVPSDQWHSHSSLQKCDYAFSPLGRKLMAIEPWDGEAPTPAAAAPTPAAATAATAATAAAAPTPAAAADTNS